MTRTVSSLFNMVDSFGDPYAEYRRSAPHTDTRPLLRPSAEVVVEQRGPAPRSSIASFFLSLMHWFLPSFYVRFTSDQSLHELLPSAMMVDPDGDFIWDVTPPVARGSRRAPLSSPSPSNAPLPDPAIWIRRSEIPPPDPLIWVRRDQVEPPLTPSPEYNLDWFGGSGYTDSHLVVEGRSIFLDYKWYGSPFRQRVG